MSKEAYSLGKAKNVLQRVHDLRWNFDLPISPLYGIETNPQNVDVICANCVGMCCVSPLMAGMTSREQRKILEDGTVWDGLVFQESGAIQEYSLRSLVPVHNRGGKVTREKGFKDMVTKVIEQASINEDASRQVLGTCGHLTGNGRCAIYNDPDKPELCDAFVEGGDQCRERFVARGTPAARKVQEILNDAEPLLQTFATVFASHPRKTEKYNFIPVRDIGVMR